VYYLTSGKATAFKPGFRMTVGNPTNRQLKNVPSSATYTCLQSPMTRNGAIKNLPNTFCPGGLMVSIRFPT